MLDDNGIGSYFIKIWSSADFGRPKPDKGFFEMAVNEVLKEHPGNTIRKNSHNYLFKRPIIRTINRYEKAAIENI